LYENLYVRTDSRTLSESGFTGFTGLKDKQDCCSIICLQVLCLSKDYSHIV